ncbi:MAG: hypothetical protein ACLFQR_05345 [Desulfovibrionales bacterium]
MLAAAAPSVSQGEEIEQQVGVLGIHLIAFIANECFNAGKRAE